MSEPARTWPAAAIPVPGLKLQISLSQQVRKTLDIHGLRSVHQHLGDEVGVPHHHVVDKVNDLVHPPVYEMPLEAPRIVMAR